METLNGIDAAMLAAEVPEWPLHVGALVVVEPLAGGPALVDVVDWVRARLRDSLPTLGVFRSRLLDAPLGLGPSAWVDVENVDLGYHVRSVAVPAPGDMSAVEELAGFLFAPPLDRRRPLWEMWVIEGLTHGRVALLAKVHHSLMDGVRGAGLFEKLFTLTPEAGADGGAGPAADSRAPRDTTLHATPDANVDPLPERTVPPMPARLVAAAETVLATPLRLLRVGASGASALRRVAHDFGRDGIREAALPFGSPRSALNGPLTDRRAVSGVRLALGDVRAVAAATGSTVNDVVLALVGDTLRGYLEKRHALPDASLTAQIPVATHRASAALSGNFVSTLGTRLHTDESDPAVRLAAIHESMVRAKALHAAMGDDLLADLFAVWPPGILRTGIRALKAAGLIERTPPAFNVIVSNVPGPPIPLYACGGRLEAIYSFGPLLMGGALNVTVMSNVDHLDVGIVTCPDVITDPSELAEGLGTALHRLVGATTADRGGPRPRAAAQPARSAASSSPRNRRNARLGRDLSSSATSNCSAPIDSSPAGASTAAPRRTASPKARSGP